MLILVSLILILSIMRRAVFLLLFKALNRFFFIWLLWAIVHCWGLHFLLRWWWHVLLLELHNFLEQRLDLIRGVLSHLAGLMLNSRWLHDLLRIWLASGERCLIPCVAKFRLVDIFVKDMTVLKGFLPKASGGLSSRKVTLSLSLRSRIGNILAQITSDFVNLKYVTRIDILLLPLLPFFGRVSSGLEATEMLLDI